MCYPFLGCKGPHLLRRDWVPISVLCVGAVSAISRQRWFPSPTLPTCSVSLNFGTSRSGFSGVLSYAFSFQLKIWYGSGIHWMQKKSCHSACVTGFVFNLVLWFQRQPSLDLCLGSMHNCIVSAACADWHHPGNHLSRFNPTSQDLWSISWWNIVLYPELTKASLWLRALLLSYIWNTSGKHWAYPWEQSFSQFFWGTGAVVLPLAKFCLLVRVVLQSCWKASKRTANENHTASLFPLWNRVYFASLW